MKKRMSTQRAKRLREARTNAGYEFAKDAAEALGVSVSTYSAHEKGQGEGGRNFKEDSARRYARKFNVPFEWLWLGQKSGVIGVAVIGNVAAGEAEFADSYEMGGADDYLPLPNTDGRIALKVCGDSMSPLARDGDYAIFGPKHEDPTPLLNRRVMARLRDGRKLFKVLRPGTERGKFSLYSLNNAYDPIEDVELDWVLPLEWLQVR